MKRQDYTVLFISSLLLTLVSGFITGVRVNLPMYMDGQGWSAPGYVDFLLGYSGYAFTAIALYSGFLVGRKHELETKYNSYIGILIVGSFTGFVTLLLPQFSPINENIVMMANIGATMSIGYILQYPANLFSGVCIGWFLRDTVISRPSIENRLVKIVGAYQGWFLIQTIIRNILYQDLTEGSRAAMIYYMGLSSLASSIIGYVYMYCLYRAGKDLDMRAVFEDVLFTLFVFSVGGTAVRSIIEIMGSQRTIASAASSLLRRTIGHGFSTFGTAFAITCYGYMRKNYRFPAFAKKTEEGSG